GGSSRGGVGIGRRHVVRPRRFSRAIVGRVAVVLKHRAAGHAFRPQVSAHRRNVSRDGERERIGRFVFYVRRTAGRAAPGQRDKDGSGRGPFGDQRRPGQAVRTNFGTTGSATPGNARVLGASNSGER